MTEERVKVEGKPFIDRVKDFGRQFMRYEPAVLILVLAVLMVALAGITKGLTIRRANLMNILLQSSMRGIAAVGQALVIITAGIDVSVGGNALFCSVLGASMVTENMRLNILGFVPPVAAVILIMMLAGSAWGVFNGALVSRIGIPALIVTLGMWRITTGAAFAVGHGTSIRRLAEGMLFIGSGKIAGVPVPVIIFVSVVVMFYFVLNHTTFGRSIYATGGNEVSAWLCGINIKRIRFMAYTISGLLAGLTAAIFTGLVMAASMASCGGLEIDSIAAATVGGVSLFGGKGNIISVAIASIIMGVVLNGLSVMKAPPAAHYIVMGSIIIAAVAADLIRRR